MYHQATHDPNSDQRERRDQREQYYISKERQESRQHPETNCPSGTILDAQKYRRGDRQDSRPLPDQNGQPGQHPYSAEGAHRRDDRHPLESRAQPNQKIPSGQQTQSAESSYKRDDRHPVDSRPHLDPISSPGRQAAPAKESYRGEYRHPVDSRPQTNQNDPPGKQAALVEGTYRKDYGHPVDSRPQARQNSHHGRQAVPGEGSYRRTDRHPVDSRPQSNQNIPSGQQTYPTEGNYRKDARHPADSRPQLDQSGPSGRQAVTGECSYRQDHRHPVDSRTHPEWNYQPASQPNPAEGSYRRDAYYQERIPHEERRNYEREQCHSQYRTQPHEYQQRQRRPDDYAVPRSGDYPPRFQSSSNAYVAVPPGENPRREYSIDGYSRGYGANYNDQNRYHRHVDRRYKEQDYNHRSGDYPPQNYDNRERQYDERKNQNKDYQRPPENPRASKPADLQDRRDFNRGPSQNNLKNKMDSKLDEGTGYDDRQYSSNQYEQDYREEPRREPRREERESVDQYHRNFKKSIAPVYSREETESYKMLNYRMGSISPSAYAICEEDELAIERMGAISPPAYVSSEEASGMSDADECSEDEVRTSFFNPNSRTRTNSEMSETPDPTPSLSVVESVKELRGDMEQLLVSPDQIKQGSSRDRSSTPKLLVEAPIAPAYRHDKEKIQVTSNFFPLEVKSKIVYRYDVNMSVVTANRTKINFSKAPRDDAGRTQRHETCVAAIRAALEMYGMLRQGEHAIYDQAAMLFSSECMDAKLKPHSNVLRISIAELPVNIRRAIDIPNAVDIAIELQPCSSGESQFDISKFRNAHKNRELSSLDRSWQQFYDMLTSEPAVHGGKYTAFGSGKLFPKNVQGQRCEKNWGQERMSGVNKGIAFIEPKENKMVPALVLDVKVGQFFKSQNVIRTVCDLMSTEQCEWAYDDADSEFPFPGQNKTANTQWNKINRYIKNLRFTMTVANTETSFLASGISRCPIDQLTELNLEGNNVPVLQCARFGHMDLSNVRRQWPAVVVRGKIDNQITVAYYPMELLTLAKNQHVPFCKMDESKPKPQHIQERFTRINNLLAELNLDSSSPQSNILKAFGVRIAPKPLSVTAIRRERPAIVGAGGRRVILNEDTGGFKFQKFVEPGVADDVVVAHDCSLDTVKMLQYKLEQVTKNQGIVINKWHYLKVGTGSEMEKVQNVFEIVLKWKKEKKVGTAVLIIYVDDVTTKSHGFLKLFERSYLIQTQHLTTRIVSDIHQKTTTLQNVLSKINCKLGGLNYRVKPDNYAVQNWIRDGRTLVFGYDVAHPTSGSRQDRMDKKPPIDPSVVGISFNGAPNPEAFIGDFHYQLPKKEQVADVILNFRVKWMMDLFVQNRRRIPKSIIILRDGVSEGQYNMVLNEEFRAIREAMEEWKNSMLDKIPRVEKWKPKFTLMVVCKRHSKRFAVEKGNKFENPKTGTVIDDTVTRTDMTQFYMQPHHTNQGSSKLPAFQVLVNNALTAETQDKLQSFIYALCFNHQIHGGAVSLPEPVYQADEWAKRGNDMYKVYQEHYEVPLLKSWNKNMYSSAPIDYEEVTRHLCYKNTPFVQNRVNA